MENLWKIGIIGCGYVGLVTGVCLASLGYQTCMQDIDMERIQTLRKGQCFFYEPGLEQMLAEYRNNLTFTTSTQEVFQEADCIFICVGTPEAADGAADLRSFDSVIREIEPSGHGCKYIVIKSTVPVGTAGRVKAMLAASIDAGFIRIISNPEFLREGSAIKDFMQPDRIVIGADCEEDAKRFGALYHRLDAPVLYTGNTEAELIKYASNNFLSTKISYINELANICARVGADIVKVAEGMGLDHRIGLDFLQAGLGFGGPCLNKDLKELISFCQRELAYRPCLLEAVLAVNELQPEMVIETLYSMLGSLRDQRFAILGLAFKPETDDMRNAPALTLIRALLREGGHVTVYDPMALPAARRILQDQVQYAATPYEAVRNAAAVILVTEWKEFLELDFARIASAMARPVLFDGRNLFRDEHLRRIREAGLRYAGIGHEEWKH